MSAHTPGPWVIDKDRIATVEPKPLTMQTPNLWAVAFASRQREEWEANARLIAAAPELLAALRQYVACDRLSDRLKQNAIDAIAKATEAA